MIGIFAIKDKELKKTFFLPIEKETGREEAMKVYEKVTKNNETNIELWQYGLIDEETGEIWPEKERLA